MKIIDKDGAQHVVEGNDFLTCVDYSIGEKDNKIHIEIRKGKNLQNIIVESTDTNNKLIGKQMQKQNKEYKNRLSTETD